MLTTFAGLFLDLPDLKSKYKDKPEQLKALREQTNRFVLLVNGRETLDQNKSEAEEMDISPEEAPKATVASGGGQATVAPCAGAGDTTTINEKPDTRNQLRINPGWSLESCVRRIDALNLEVPPTQTARTAVTLRRSKCA